MRLGDPQVDRSTQPQNEQRTVGEDEEVALHVVEETKDGVIVTGGKQLSTAAPHSHECYVSLSATFARRSNPKCVLAFAIPTNAPGLKILAREPVSRWFGSWGHPLQMLDEQDCMLFFDHVLVPWDRLFMLYDPTPMVRMLGADGGGVNFNFLGWSNLCRVEVRMRLLTAVATMVAEAIGVIDYREVAAKLGEMATYCEVWRHAMDGVEHRAGPTPSGQWTLGAGARPAHLVHPGIRAAWSNCCARSAPPGSSCSRARTISPAPRSAPISTATCAAGTSMSNTSRACSDLAHDLAASSYGLRQEIYEYWHGGDPNRNRINLLRSFDQRAMQGRIRELLKHKLAHGETP